MSKPSKPSKKPSRSSKSSKSSRTSKSSQPSSAPAKSTAPAKSKDSSKNKRPRRSSSVSIEEVQPRPRKRVRKPAAAPTDEESEDVSWVDRQDSLPPEEVAEGEPEKDTLEWHQWNLTSSLIPTKWKAPFYRHFPKVSVIWDEKKEKFLHRFQCKYSESVICTRAVGDSTTTNLKRHADLCDAKHGKDMTTQMKVTSSIPRQFHKGEFRLQLVEWVTRRHRPDIIVEDDELVQLFSYLNPSVKTPSRPTLRRDLHAVFSLTLLEVKKLLQEYKGRFNIIYDCWTAGSGHEFLSIMVSFAYQGKLLVLALDLVEMTVAHTGRNLAAETMKVLKAFNIAERTLGHTGDNASNNDSMLNELEALYTEYEGSLAGRDTQIRCFGHILNLTYQALCRQFEPLINKKTPSHDDQINPDADVDEWQDDPEDDEMSADEEETARAAQDILEHQEKELEALWAESAREPLEGLTVDEDSKGRSAMQKIIKIGHRCARKSPLQKSLAEYCQLRNIKKLKMVKRVPTRWNTMYNVVDRALKLRKAIHSLTLSPAHNVGPPTKRLKRYNLSDEEWLILESLRPLLKLLHDATTRISSSKYPMLHEVIPIIDVLNKKLEEAVANNALPLVVRRGVQRAIMVLDKYYSRTDESIMWKTAMLFHPKYRRNYFERAGWEDNWINTAVVTAREIWTTHYRVASPSRATSSAPSELDDAFSELDAPVVSSDRDPFDDFVSGSPTEEDPVHYWSIELEAGRNPMKKALARMALDFLSAPATSTDVERLFSHAGLVVAKRRYNLSPTHIRESTILNNWLKVDNLVPRSLCRSKLNTKYGKKGQRPKSDSEWSDSEIEVVENADKSVGSISESESEDEDD